jgi:hypothetical protein
LAIGWSTGWGTIGICEVVGVVFSGAIVAKDAFVSTARIDDMWKFLVAMDVVVFVMMIRVVAGNVPAIDIRNADLLSILNLDCLE